MILRFNLKSIHTRGIRTGMYEMWKPFIDNTIPNEGADPEIEVVYFLWAGVKDGLRNKVKS